MLVDKMIVRLYVLNLDVEDGVLRKLDVVEVVVVDPKVAFSVRYGFACHDSRSSVLSLRARQCNCRMLVAAPRDHSAPKREHIPRG